MDAPIQTWPTIRTEAVSVTRVTAATQADMTSATPSNASTLGDMPNSRSSAGIAAGVLTPLPRQAKNPPVPANVAKRAAAQTFGPPRGKSVETNQRHATMATKNAA